MLQYHDVISAYEKFVLIFWDLFSRESERVLQRFSCAIDFIDEMVQVIRKNKSF